MTILRLKNPMNKQTTELMFSSKSVDWSTPQDLYDDLNQKYGPFVLDVCATYENTKCPCFMGYFKSGEFVDGLSDTWFDAFDGMGPPKCWMNPPYGRGIGAWVKKAYEESLHGCTVVCLLPARTDTKWFHEYCTKGQITFLKGRLKFGGHKNAAPFPSMIVVFRSE